MILFSRELPLNSIKVKNISRMNFWRNKNELSWYGMREVTSEFQEKWKGAYKTTSMEELKSNYPKACDSNNIPKIACRVPFERDFPNYILSQNELKDKQGSTFAVLKNLFI